MSSTFTYKTNNQDMTMTKLEFGKIASLIDEAST